MFENLSIGQMVRVYKEANGYRIGVVVNDIGKLASGHGEIIEIRSDFLRVRETYHRRGKIHTITRTIPVAAITAIEARETRDDPDAVQASKGGNVGTAGTKQ